MDQFNLLTAVEKFGLPTVFALLFFLSTNKKLERLAVAIDKLTGVVIALSSVSPRKDIQIRGEELKNVSTDNK